MGTDYPTHQDNRWTTTVTIDSGSALSEILNMQGHHLGAIGMSTAWTGAAISFLGGDSTAAMRSIYTEGGEVAFPAAVVDANRDLAPSSTMAGALAARRYLQLRSGVSSAAVNQDADRVLSLVMLPLSVGGQS